MKKTLTLILALMLLMSTVAMAEGPIKVTMLKSAAGNDSHIEWYREAAALFKDWTGGKYELAMEEIPGMAVDLRTKYKQMNAAGNLTAIVTDLGAEPAFHDLLVENGRLIDLKPYFDADEQWQATALPQSIAFNTSEDGKMYTTPATSTDYTGIYWNKELFAQAGIEAFPTTWEEFWDACDKLKAIGVAPLSLHTTETGWCPMLIATSYLASSSDEGQTFMNTYFPSDFNNDAVLSMAEFIQKEFQYTTGDAVGGTYALASNNFCAGKTAMIANGPWMISSFYDPQYAPEGFADKVSYSPYPCGFMISNGGEGYGNAISVDVSEEEQMGALEWFKFQATPDQIRSWSLEAGAMSNLVALTDEQLDSVNGLMKDYYIAVADCTNTLPSYQSKWDSVVQAEVIEQELPSLAQGNITPEEFMNKMTEGAQRYLAESQG